MMTCREVAGFLQEYVAGDLSPDLLAAFERHLGDCSNCREFLSQYRATIAAAAGAWTTEADVDAPPELVSAILSSLQGL
jgi:anti-sigma factor RsiW